MNENYSLQGLTTEEVQIRVSQGEINTPPKSITKTTWDIIRENVFTLFNAFNLAIGICIALVGAYSNLFFLGIIALNVTIGIVQELRAKKKVEELSILSSPRSIVIRNGKEEEIHNESIVRDDLIVLVAGSFINADSTLLNGEIEVNESMLTGESDAIIKRAGDSILSGSFVISGRCQAQVIHVGQENYATSLTESAKKHKPVNSDLIKAFRKVTKITSFFIIPLGIILFCEAYFGRHDIIQESVVKTAAALLGMLPKGLVLLTSISLAIGVINLAKKRVLIQELYATETLSYIDVLCLDKTGTLTEGIMSVSDVYALNTDILPQPLTDMMAHFLRATDDNNATYEALCMHFGQKEESFAVQSRVPFSSARKWSSVSFAEQGTILVGAPDILSPDFPIEGHMLQAQKEGARVLMIAYSKHEIIDYHVNEAIPVALVLLADPVRQDVAETLAFFSEENVAIKIISGDNPETVSAIAKQAGVHNAESFIDASMLSDVSSLEKALESHTVFGRVSPNQKTDMVQILQKQGHKVAMTGDGVNDVLALRNADCSIAMGEGSNAARQVSQVVLLDSQFNSMKDIVMEGRRIMNNMTRSASIFYLKTIYSVLLSIVCAIVNMPFPFIPIQITLIDLAIEGYPSFFMAFEPDHRKVTTKFLPTVMGRALPSAILIVLQIILVALLTPVFGLSEGMEITLMYYLTSMTAILLVLRCSLPLNKLRTFLVISMTVGFYFATILFKNLLHIDLLTGPALVIFIVATALIYPLTSALGWVVQRFLKKES